MTYHSLDSHFEGFPGYGLGLPEATFVLPSNPYLCQQLVLQSVVTHQSKTSSLLF